jgi:hypothetical protein
MVLSGDNVAETREKHVIVISELSDLIEAALAGLCPFLKYWGID